MSGSGAREVLCHIHIWNCIISLLTLSVPFSSHNLHFRHTQWKYTSWSSSTLCLSFVGLQNVAPVALNLRVFRAFAHIPGRGPPNYSRGLQECSLPSWTRQSLIFCFFFFYGANRWSLVGTHSLWASCPTKRLSVIVPNLCCFYAALGSTAVVKRPKATLSSLERNKQTKP